MAVPCLVVAGGFSSTYQRLRDVDCLPLLRREDALAGKHMREVIAIARTHDNVQSKLPAYLAMASWNARALADDMARGLDEEDDDGSAAEGLSCRVRP